MPKPFAGLSERELDLVRLVAAGLSNAEIGERLVLGTGTVKTNISRFLTRLDRRDRVQLAVLAYDSGLVRPGRQLPDRAQTRPHDISDDHGQTGGGGAGRGMEFTGGAGLGIAMG